MIEDPQEDQVAEDEGTPEEAPEEKPLSVEELRTEFDEIGARAKSAGLKPFRQMARAYLDNALDAVDGLLSALEGNKRKKGD